MEACVRRVLSVEDTSRVSRKPCQYVQGPSSRLLGTEMGPMAESLFDEFRANLAQILEESEFAG